MGKRIVITHTYRQPTARAGVRIFTGVERRTIDTLDGGTRVQRSAGRTLKPSDARPSMNLAMCATRSHTAKANVEARAQEIRQQRGCGVRDRRISAPPRSITVQVLQARRAGRALTRADATDKWVGEGDAGSGGGPGKCVEWMRTVLPWLRPGGLSLGPPPTVHRRETRSSGAVSSPTSTQCHTRSARTPDLDHIPGNRKDADYPQLRSQPSLPRGRRSVSSRTPTPRWTMWSQSGGVATIANI